MFSKTRLRSARPLRCTRPGPDVDVTTPLCGSQPHPHCDRQPESGVVTSTQPPPATFNWKRDMLVEPYFRAFRTEVTGLKLPLRRAFLSSGGRRGDTELCPARRRADEYGSGEKEPPTLTPAVTDGDQHPWSLETSTRCWMTKVVSSGRLRQPACRCGSGFGCQPALGKSGGVRRNPG